MKVLTIKEAGFCFGVKRAIKMLENAARDYGSVETLGALVHNEIVMDQLKAKGVRVIHSLEDISCETVAISAHGLSPAKEALLRQKGVKVIDTTCPRVKYAQMAAKKLHEEGFFSIIFGDEKHPEVEGIKGWAGGQSVAILQAEEISRWEKIPRKAGILSQTTQVPENFARFSKDVVDIVLSSGAEIRIIDTVCEDVRNRQQLSLQLAKQVDLMLVVGGTSSANTRRLLEICAAETETFLIGKAEDINSEWLSGKSIAGITSGTSTPETTIIEIKEYLNRLN